MWRPPKMAVGLVEMMGVLRAAGGALGAPTPPPELWSRAGSEPQCRRESQVPENQARPHCLLREKGNFALAIGLRRTIVSLSTTMNLFHI